MSVVVLAAVPGTIATFLSFSFFSFFAFCFLCVTSKVVASFVSSLDY